MAWYRCRHTGSGGGVQPIGDATDGDVLSGKTYMNANGASTGTMTNNGAVSPSGLNCGGSYTIPEGYHDGNGVVTANSLASQTGVDSGKTAAEAAQILSGYQAWVNGNKVTGSMGNRTRSNPQGKDTEITNVDNCPVYITTEYYLLDNKDGVRRLCLIPPEGKDGFYAAHNSAIAIAGSILGTANAGQIVSGYTASSQNGLGISGTFTGQTKTSTPTTRSATAATVTPDSGKYLTKVTVNTTSVPNSNSGTKTITSSDTNWLTGDVDMGATNTFRYVNAVNVYNQGKSDGASAWTASSIATVNNSSVYLALNASATISVTKNKTYLLVFNSTVADTACFTGITITGGTKKTPNTSSPTPFTNNSAGVLPSSAYAFLVNTTATSLTITNGSGSPKAMVCYKIT